MEREGDGERREEKRREKGEKGREWEKVGVARGELRFCPTTKSSQLPKKALLRPQPPAAPRPAVSTRQPEGEVASAFSNGVKELQEEEYPRLRENDTKFKLSCPLFSGFFFFSDEKSADVCSLPAGWLG